ncbi:hypothetical protein EPI10_005423 [Gossypium australe]|uniref:Uncharacterized protein n=1 Tax=Gossypium australe TaxID=47621 RepID=A0A5B6WQY4_9ROSI|nr:hypothetical protein EPI10_005423 [Gossypium australe]
MDANGGFVHINVNIMRYLRFLNMMALVHLTSNLLAHEIESQVKAERSITIAVLSAKIKDKFSYDVSYKKKWHAKTEGRPKCFW